MPNNVKYKNFAFDLKHDYFFEIITVKTVLYVNRNNCYLHSIFMYTIRRYSSNVKKTFWAASVNKISINIFIPLVVVTMLACFRGGGGGSSLIAIITVGERANLDGKKRSRLMFRNRIESILYFDAALSSSAPRSLLRVHCSLFVD